MAEEARWRLRFENFERALGQLETSVGGLPERGLSDIEQAGLIKQFEYSWELGWKSMRDFLFETGTRIKVPVPANVIRAAHEVGLIEDGASWMDAKNARNQMSHEYSRDDAEKIVADIRRRYLPLLIGLRRSLTDERARGN